MVLGRYLVFDIWTLSVRDNAPTQSPKVYPLLGVLHMSRRHSIQGTEGRTGPPSARGAGGHVDHVVLKRGCQGSRKDGTKDPLFLPHA